MIENAAVRILIPPMLSIMIAFLPIKTTTNPDSATIPIGGTIARQIAFLGFVGGALGFSTLCLLS